jgi:hypothetical protein
MAFDRREFSVSELADQLAAERRGRPVLLYRDAERAQRLLVLAGERVSVGREEGNELQLGWDPEASRVHALLERVGGSWIVSDDQLSRNGTFVNGTRVRGRRRLDDRDVIRFGTTQVYYRSPAETPGETAPAARGAHAAEVTPAQHRVLVGLCRPLLDPRGQAAAPQSNGEIAAELTISVEAIRSHMKQLFRLFEVPDLPQNRKRAELARRALAAGVVSLRDLSG